MRRVQDVFVRALAVLLPLLLLAAALNRGGAPAFSTGAPGEGTCAACHTGNPLNDPAGSLQLVAPDTYAPGETIEVTVRAARPGAARFGFQITAQDGAGNPVGTFDVSADNIQLALGSPDHVTHAPAADSNGEFEWAIPWEAPAVGAGEVVFYAAANMANADFSTTGDFIYTVQRGLEQGGATNSDRLDDAFPARFSVGAAYPNPVAAHERLLIPVDGRPDGRVHVQVYDLEGRQIPVITPDAHAESLAAGRVAIETGSLVPGVYMARILEGRAVHTTPFVVMR